MNHDSRIVRRRVAVAVLTGLALLLAGCGAHYDFVIHDNETADLSYVMWDSSGLSLISRESCTQAKLEKSTPLPKGVKANYTFTSHNGQPACQVTAKSVPLNNLQTDIWTIKHQGGKYVFDLSPEALGKLGKDDSLPTSPGTSGGMKISVSVTFPEEVTKSNGRNDDNKVTWDNVMESSEALHAEGGDGTFHLQWWMIATAGAVVLLIVVGVVVYLLRTRRAKRLAPALPYGQPYGPAYGQAFQGAEASSTMPPEVYTGGPYQSPPSPLQPMPGSTHPYPVTNLRDGYAPYVDPGQDTSVLPPPHSPGGAGVFSTYGAQQGGPQSPGPGYTQMPYQEGHSQSDFRPPPGNRGND